MSAALGAIASVIFLIRLLPQPLRTLRTGFVSGVSGLSALNAVVADCVWVTYGLAAGVLPVWLVSVPALVISAWTLYLVRRTARVRDVVAAASWLAVILVCWQTHVLAVALGATVLMTCGPQLWAALRHHSPDGLSHYTWWVAILDASAWGGYGITIHNLALEIYGVVLVSTAVTILLRLRRVQGSVGVELIQ